MSSRYSEWLQFVFDRPTTSDAWYFDPDFEEFCAQPSELADLIATTFEQCGRDFANFSDEQIRYGLSYILENSCSDTVYALKSDDVPMASRLRAIRSLKNLYSGIFEDRCAPVLGHLSQGGGNALNYSCYMLWDASNLSYWESCANSTVFYGAVSEVLNHALHSSNSACVESALHGLGHIHLYYPRRVEEIIDTFIKSSVARFPELRQYAQAARTGNVL
jgi:hypothetical protein